MDRKKVFSEFLAEAKKREIQGLVTYGDFDPKTDKRVLSIEAQEECVDILNYMRFLLRKHPNLREPAYGVRRLAFELYRELRKLEEQEVTSESRKP